MQINPNDWKWRQTAEQYSRGLYDNLVDIETHWLMKVALIVAFLVFWVVGMVVVSIVFLALDMILSALSSVRAFKSWFYGAIIGATLLYPFVGKFLNLSYLYAEVTNYPASGPDPLASLREYKYERYATAPNHEAMIRKTLREMAFMNDATEIDDYIQRVAPGSPVTGEMVMRHATRHDVDRRLMMALMYIDSHFGLYGRAARTKNPGNVGNDDAGHNKYFKTWDDGVEAVAKWLDRNRKFVAT